MTTPAAPAFPSYPTQPILSGLGGVPFNMPHISYWRGKADRAEAAVAELQALLHSSAAEISRLALEARTEECAKVAERSLQVSAQVAARSNLVGHGAEFYGAAAINVAAAIRKLQEQS